MSADAPDSPPQQPLTEIVPAYPTNLVPRQSACHLATNQRRAAETPGIFYSPQSRGMLGFVFVPMASWLRLFHPQPLHLRRKK
jgi:hypothetical protein